MSLSFDTISEKVKSGIRINEAEALFLFSIPDPLPLGELANFVREKIHGDKTYFIKNKHIDYSNVCAIRCKFCAFARKAQEEGAFQYSIDEIVEKVKAGAPRGITEVHIVGGFHPTHPWEFYTGMLSQIKKECPAVHVKAFTAGEIRYFSKKFRKTEEEVLKELMAAGLDSMPGGGAEILAEEVRKEICGPKGPAQAWIDTHKRAHQVHLKSNATMLYGHIESLADRVEHMRLVRHLQDETGGFLSFIPLAFNPMGTAYESRGFTSGLDDLKTLAISRLYMDNFKHIKAYWIMSGVDMAQIAQHFGADDIHGTVIEENITHMAGAQTPEDLPEKNILSLIREAHRVPVQRDSLYNEIRHYA